MNNEVLFKARVKTIPVHHCVSFSFPVDLYSSSELFPWDIEPQELMLICILLSIANTNKKASDFTCGLINGIGFKTFYNSEGFALIGSFDIGFVRSHR